MATVIFRQSTWNGLSAKQKAVLRYASSLLELGDPAIYQNGGVNWLVLDDHRYDLEDAKWMIGIINSNAELLLYDTNNADGTPKSKDTIRSEVRAIVASNKPNSSDWDSLNDSSPFYVRHYLGVPSEWSASN